MKNNIKSIVKKYKDIPDFMGVEISSIDTKNVYNDQLLHVATVNGDKLSVETLLSEGALVNDRGENGFTPLHYAVEQGHYDIVLLLLSHGADKNIENDFCETPLDLANNLSENRIKNALL